MLSNISSSENVNIAPGGQVPLSIQNLIVIYMHFLKTIPQEKTTLMKREKFQ